MTQPLLEVNNLTLDYDLGGRKTRALDRVGFHLEKGRVLGVAGESGCGKSTLGLSIMGLLPQNAQIRRGEIVFQGSDLLRLSDEEMDREIRGQKISMIFQNPQDALNPVFTIETQMTDCAAVSEKIPGGQKTPEPKRAKGPGRPAAGRDRHGRPGPAHL